MRHTGCAQGILVSFYIVIPKLMFGIIGFADLPVTRGIIEPLLEARKLFLLADVEEELQNGGSTLGERGFEAADQLITSHPSRLADQFMNPCDKNVLVVRPVED